MEIVRDTFWPYHSLDKDDERDIIDQKPAHAFAHNWDFNCRSWQENFLLEWQQQLPLSVATTTVAFRGQLCHHGQLSKKRLSMSTYSTPLLFVPSGQTQLFCLSNLWCKPSQKVPKRLIAFSQANRINNSSMQGARFQLNSWSRLSNLYALPSLAGLWVVAVSRAQICSLPLLPSFKAKAEAANNRRQTADGSN